MGNYFKNAAGKLIKRASGLYMKAAACCCGPSACCDDPGGPPTADFSYTQTDDDPCLFNFFDESTPGTCGDIVTWEWSVDGGGVFSTVQYPTDVDLEAESGHTWPWFVTLKVTDEARCEDLVEMELECGTFCANCLSTDFLPSSLTVTFPVLPATSICGCAAVSGGTFNVEHRPDIGCNRYTESFPCVNGNVGISVIITSSTITVTATITSTVGGPTGQIDWFLTKPDAPSSCLGTFSVPWQTRHPSSSACGVGFGPSPGDATVQV